ncbi:MAG TPA: hypothetical protein VNX27_11565 [Chthoniobacterales bacterium]|jgi:hypothetical protein|nr:hypothetical protein [Chthoniobacterales bacterium]
MKRIALLAISLSLLFSGARLAQPDESKPASLDDLKKLPITCFVPSYLPKGFKLKEAEISYDEGTDEEGQSYKAPLYGIEWSDGKGTFSIEAAAEGIGDRNIMETEDSEEAEIQSPLFGRIYIIYTPKGKEGAKREILTNWVEDEQMKADQAKSTTWHGQLGRFHGFTGRKMTVAEFSKVVTSLHPIKGDGKTTSRPPPLKLHPRIFDMIDCWLSDSESPVVTEINLDAVEMNKNEFDMDEVKPDGEWTRAPKEDGGFMRYRVLGLKGNTYTVEYQENGGGSLTTDSTIEFDIGKRSMQRDGKTENIRILRVVSYKSK